MAYDNSQLALIMLQWLGASPRRWPINRDLGDLALSTPAGHDPLWTFVRYDAPLEAGWLKDHLGTDYSAERLAALGRIDDDRQVPELFDIGQRAGAALIRPEHFADAFDPAAPAFEPVLQPANQA